MQPAVFREPAADVAVKIPAGATYLRGEVMSATNARGLVIVCNGDGDHVYDETNAYIARELRKAGFAILVVDLLTCGEAVEDAETSALRFGVRLLASRMVSVTRWVRREGLFNGLEIGLFASGLCGGASLLAGMRSSAVNAVVCRGARLDAVVAQLRHAGAEVLLLVGERDTAHLDCNRRAFRLLPKGSCLTVVPNAGHLLDDAGPLQKVVCDTESWFACTLQRRARRSDG